MGNGINIVLRREAIVTWASLINLFMGLNAFFLSGVYMYSMKVLS